MFLKAAYFLDRILSKNDREFIVAYCNRRPTGPPTKSAWVQRSLHFGFCDDEFALAAACYLENSGFCHFNFRLHNIILIVYFFSYFVR
jgi:hypothetical protein